MWLVPPERRVTFGEGKMLMQIEGNELEEGFAPPDNVIDNIPAVDGGVKDGWDLQDILPSSAIDVRSVCTSISQAFKRIVVCTA